MLLQLAEGEKQQGKNSFAYVHLPNKKVQVREDYFDDYSLSEMASELSENGYSPTEISELAGRRAQRKAAAPAARGAQRAAAPARSGSRPGQVRRAEKKTEKKAFKTAKREQKILKKASKSEIRSARASKKRDTGAMRKSKGEARIIKAQTPKEDLLDTVLDVANTSVEPAQNYDAETENYQDDEQLYVPEVDAPETEEEQLDLIDTEDLEPAEMAEYLAAKRRIDKKKLTTALVKGLTTATKSYTAGTKKPPIYKDIRKQMVKDSWDETLFTLGKTPVTKKQAAIGGTLLFFTGLVLKKSKVF